MERQANYVLVGALSLVLLIGALVFIVWLAQFQFNQTYDRYRIILQGPVSGLGEGGEVQFNGIKVGQIVRIALDERDANRVLTDIDVEHGTPVRVDSTAQPAALGITGVKYIQITPGSADKPLLREASKDRPPIIPAGRSRMENFVEDLSTVVQGGTETLTRINRLLSDENIATIGGSLNDIRAVTVELKDRRTMFASMESAFGKLDRAAGDVQAAAASARGTMGGDGRKALAEVAASATELRAMIADTRSLLAKVNAPVSELSTNTIPGINTTLASIQQAADALNRVVSEVEQEPRSLLVSPKGEEVEVPQ